MSKQTYVIVWNERKTEGVIFKNEMGDGGEDDARHASGKVLSNPCSTLADAFHEIYGECGNTFIQEIKIDSTETIPAEKF